MNEFLKPNNLDKLIRQKLSFALFRLPGYNEINLVVQTCGQPEHKESILTLNNTKGFIMVPFSIGEHTPLVVITPDIIAKGVAEINVAFQHLNLNTPLTDTDLGSPHTEDANNDFVAYSNMFQVFKQALTDQEFKKLVLSRTKTITTKGNPELETLFCRACEKYPAAFVYLLYTPATGVWMGSTPEMLLQGDTNHLTTVALAGTMKLDNSAPISDWSNKNVLEQQLVTDYIRERLRSNHLEWNEDELQTAKAGDLVHLKTVFHFALGSDTQLGDLINDLHPTPAVCGLPKEKAYRFIIENEIHNRKYYSGLIGWLEPEGKSHLYVNLRCMEIHNKAITLYAGGGLLESSDLESEWLETEDKMQTMLSILTQQKQLSHVLK